MPNYQKNKNYKLCCKDPNIKQIYIGSTCNFRSRKRGHKSSCINEKSKKYNLYVYQFIRNNGNWENWDMIEIEPYPCSNKREKETRERYWIEELKAELNSNIPTRSRPEWQKENRKKFPDKRKIETVKYYKKYRDKKLQYAKIYAIENKKKIKEYKKQYRIKNIDKIKNKEAIKINCQCGSIISNGNKSRHERSKKHIEYIENLSKPSE